MAIRIKGGGILNGTLCVPQFELHDGESASFVLPEDFMIQSDQPLTQLFEGLKAICSINGRAVCAEPAQPRHRYFWSWFLDNSASGFLRCVGGVSRDEAKTVLRKLDIPSDNIWRLPGNFRLMLGIEAALARKPDLLVFATIAVDSTGQRFAFSAAGEQCRHGASLYFSFPYLRQGKVGYREFPGSTVIRLTRYASAAA